MAIIPLKVKIVWCSHTDRFCWCKWMKSLQLSRSIFGLYGKLFDTMIVKNSDQAALIEPFSDLLLVSV